MRAHYISTPNRLVPLRREKLLMPAAAGSPLAWRPAEPDTRQILSKICGLEDVTSQTTGSFTYHSNPSVETFFIGRISVECTKGGPLTVSSLSHLPNVMSFECYSYIMLLLFLLLAQGQLS